MNTHQSYKISCVSYLNSKPFIYGLESSTLLKDGEIELSLDIPSRCADKLVTNEADLGLVPVACLPQLKSYQFISNYCIGAKGKVNSVNLYSQVPITQIKEIVLDYQSLTSINLTKILCKYYWKITPKYTDGDNDYISKIKNTTAAVIIGDRTFSIEDNYKYIYDLSEEWQKFTGLPFVFATWVSNKILSPDFLTKFETALSFGISQVEHVADMYKMQYKPYDVKTYLKTYIDYTFDDEKKQALELFLTYLKKV